MRQFHSITPLCVSVCVCTQPWFNSHPVGDEYLFFCLQNSISYCWHVTLTIYEPGVCVCTCMCAFMRVVWTQCHRYSGVAGGCGQWLFTSRSPLSLAAVPNGCKRIKPVLLHQKSSWSLQNFIYSSLPLSKSDNNNKGQRKKMHYNRNKHSLNAHNHGVIVHTASIHHSHHVCMWLTLNQ